MLDTTVHVIAKVTALPGSTEKLKVILLDLIQPTRLEKGCLRYQLLQDKENPAEFVCSEVWEDDLAEQAHMATAHVQAALAKSMPLLALPPEITRYRLIS